MCLTLSMSLVALSTWLYFTVDETPRVGSEYAIDYNGTQVDLSGLMMELEGVDPFDDAQRPWMVTRTPESDLESAFDDEPLVTRGEEVPEPTTLAILGFGGIGLLFRRRRRRNLAK